MDFIRDWFKRHFNDPQVVLLIVLLAALFAMLVFFANMLLPALAAAIIAYLMQGVVSRLERLGVPRIAAILCVFLIFFGFFLFVILAVIPLIFSQITLLIQQVPSMLNDAQELMRRLPEEYPNVFSADQVDQMFLAIRSEVISFSQQVLTYSLASIVSIATLLVYAILVPLLVFFMVKDKDRILAWFTSFLPEDRRLAAQVWEEVDVQLGNYIRGKFWEILIVGVVTFIVFWMLDMTYAVLLAVLTGLSVLIPYIGAAMVTFPVAVLGYLQFGWGSELVWILIAYAIIQAIDGNVLAPLLFSEAVSLHPVAVVVAILFFGGIWGFWGVFFAIPLATVVQAVLRAWPRSQARERRYQMGIEPESSAEDARDPSTGRSPQIGSER
ncbi:AI-2E family transporter [Fodinicurvata sp. EGI_FJ10296]|uniref:AI-2E family transporter n=1 Tax=Fodinicurvata sp. EGI_FJ10296 TaxID=3231908 RepID=UPI003456DCC4